MPSTRSSSRAQPPLPSRVLGKTGLAVTLFGLGGEGILRTHGRTAEAVQVIDRALSEGVTYFDTAPAYASSMDYYGAVLGERRKDIFLASKTHERTREKSLRLLADSLRRLRTDHVDLWQLHDLRTLRELDTIFAPGGAIEALVRAREQGLVRFLGLTGHHDPAVLLEAMRRFDFDTVLVALNAADVHRQSFIRSVLPEAMRRGMGVIGMKVLAAGRMVSPGLLSADEAIHYVLSQPGVTNVIVGCRTPAEVEKNARAVRQFQPLTAAEQQQREERTGPYSGALGYYKAAASMQNDDGD